MNPSPKDPLLQRYQEANEMDGARPGDGLRKAVSAHAGLQAKALAPMLLLALDLTAR